MLERVADLSEVIRAGGDEAQQLRRLPQHTVDALIEAGFFRFTLPAEVGGENASSMETIAVLEAMAAIDGSVGWNVMLGSEINAMAVGGMDPVLRHEIYVENPRIIMCGGGGPGTRPGKAIREADDSYRVWGQASFISGCHNAEWCFMAAPVFVGDELQRDTNGAPVVRMFFLNRREYQILDTWDMAGLRGSGSHDVLAEGAHVPARLANVNLWALPAQFDNPVYRMPVPLRLAYNKAAIALGVARGTMREFHDLAANKTPLMSPSLLKDRPIAQHRFGHAEATVRAARAYLMEAMSEVEDELRAGREVPSAHATQNARLACVFAANATLEAVDLVHNAAGTTAMRMDSPLERKLRDAHACANHRWVAHPLYGELGRILLGGAAGVEFDGSAAVISNAK